MGVDVRLRKRGGPGSGTSSCGFDGNLESELEVDVRLITRLSLLNPRREWKFRIINKVSGRLQDLPSVKNNAPGGERCISQISDFIMHYEIETRRRTL